MPWVVSLDTLFLLLVYSLMTQTQCRVSYFAKEQGSAIDSTFYADLSQLAYASSITIGSLRGPATL